MGKISKFMTGATAFVLTSSVFFSSVQAEESNSLSDIQGSRFAEEIQRLVDEGVVDGYTDGTFRPKEELTRQQAAKLIAEARDLTTPEVIDPMANEASNTFRDYVAATIEAGIFEGNSDGSFGATDTLTREQMASVLVRAFDLEFDNLPFEFTDADSFSPSHSQDIFTLAEYEITFGYTDGGFRPEETVDREMFAAFVYRTMDNLGLLTPDITSGDIAATEWTVPFDPSEDGDYNLTFMYDGFETYADELINYGYDVTFKPSVEGALLDEKTGLINSSKFEYGDTFTYSVMIKDPDGELVTEVSDTEAKAVDFDTTLLWIYEGTLFANGVEIMAEEELILSTSDKDVYLGKMIGSNFKLEDMEVMPEDVELSSENPEIVEVAADGTISINSAGTALLTLKTEFSESQIQIEVVDEARTPSELVIPGPVEVTAGDTHTFTALVTDQFGEAMKDVPLTNGTVTNEAGEVIAEVSATPSNELGEVEVTVSGSLAGTGTFELTSGEDVLETLSVTVEDVVEKPE
ncbi:S-layer homology domain-containing protein [Bacillus fonticola]|uniref:S-layer homology domain-containing protein n=1 Tax=Bacillus fonticola TaxID=2728853 RepID=UPI001474C8E5|nr:S-layer homology domain-containing protein [Bacillus fonticola]